MTKPAPTAVRDLLQALSGPDPLGKHAPGATPGVESREDAESGRSAAAEVLAGWQERLYAEGRRSLLLVLQGMDTSGKGGVIKKVIGAVNPQGCRIVGFKKPTAEESSHDFLWRVERALPRPGQMGIFDRSHYEDVIVPRVHDTIEAGAWEARHDEILAFEAGLAEGGTTVVKCLLHISHEEQRQRLLARLDDPTKHWKFNEADLAERAHWPKYQGTFREMIRRTHTPAAPWHVIPADRKWYRNWAVTQILIETFERMAPDYPRVDLDIPALRARLTAPG